MDLKNRQVKKRYSLMLIAAMLSSTIIIAPSITTAASKSATWTTKGDFENNASTTLSPTLKNNVGISGTLPNDNANVALSGNYGLLGSNFAVSAATNDQYSSSIAYNSTSNQFMIAWQDYRSASISNLYAQRINADGTLAGPEIEVSTAADEQVYPSIAYNPSSNQFMVAWQDHRNSSSKEDIYAQRINADGALAGSNFAVSTAVESQGSPSIAYNSTSNQFMVTWQDWRSGSSPDIYAQRVNANGVLAGSNFPIAAGPNNQSGPSIAYNPTSNQFMIAWDDYNNIYAQRVNADGTLAGSEIAVSTASKEKSSTVIAHNPTSNQFMIAWNDLRNGSNYDVYAQRINADGNLAGSEIALSTTIGDQASPSIAYNTTSNQFMVTWGDEDYIGSGIYAQRINPDGTLAGPEIAVSTGANSYQPSIAYNSASNQFMIVWEDFRNGSEGDIYAQRVGVVNYPLSGTLSGLKINAGNGNKGKWSAISWNGLIPWNTSIKFRTRGADSEASLASAGWSGYYTTSGSAISTPDSQWLEIEATLVSTDGANTPTLNDFTVSYDVIGPAQSQNPINILSTFLSLSAKPKVIKKGKALTIKGQLKDSAGKPVVGKKVVLKQKVLKKIKKKVKGKIKLIKKWIWKAIATLTTDSKGNFAKKLKPKDTTLYKAEYAGDSSYKAASSKAVKVIVKKSKKKKT